jgi:hypothetical protein
VVVLANYYFRSTEITDGSCKFSMSTSVFNATDQIMLGEMKYSSIYGAYINLFPLYVRQDASSGTATIVVTCNKSGYYAITNSTSVRISSVDAELVLSDSLRNGNIGTDDSVGVTFRYTNSSGISPATCDLYVRNAFSGLLTELVNGSGRYSGVYEYEWTGINPYNVTCTATGIGSMTVSSTFTVSPTTTTLKSPKPPTPPAHCDNGRRDYDESDVDCGGSDCDYCQDGDRCNEQDDCENYCNQNAYPAVCGTPQCPDGFKWSGYTNFYIDCGAPSCPPCECGDSQLLTGCAQDGSEHCDSSAGKCQLDSCLDDFQCPQLYLRINDTTTWVSRLCDLATNVCKFRYYVPQPNASTSMIVYPLSGVTFQSGGYNFLFGNCEDKTNGFRITTPVSTHTQYKIDISPFSPTILPTLRWTYFGSDGKDKSAVIPELCNLMGEPFRYARIEFHSEVNGGLVSAETVDMMIYKSSFNVNVTPSSTYDNGAVFGLSRYGTCFIRPDRITEYTFIGNGTYIDADYGAIVNVTSIEWLCNSTYNEVKTGTFGHTGSWLFIWGIGLVWSFLFGWIEWKPWYLLIVVLVLMIVFPLLYLIWRDRRD